MEIDNKLLEGYENMQLIHYREVDKNFTNASYYDDLPEKTITGALKANFYKDGKLLQIYSEKDNHVGVVAATRLGKTTSYVIPTVLSFAAQKQKKSMVVSDPKGEVYRYTAATLREQGYNVLLLNFRDYQRSECWNPLTPIFRKYQAIDEEYTKVELVDTDQGPRNRYNGVIYEDQEALDEALENVINMRLEEVGSDIDVIANLFMPTVNTRDPYWENSARELLQAFLWAMLEDSKEDAKDRIETLITEDTYSFSTIIRILGTMEYGKGNSYGDGGYFNDRSKDSRAYGYAKNTILENADTTRKCIMSVFNSNIAIFKNCAVRLITSCNTFEYDDLIGKPVALFIDYRDEIKIYYKIISLFVQNVYAFLIDYADKTPMGKFDASWYFILDEFGNFPEIEDFDMKISASAGRNVFFILIMQSYAQLDNVYGSKVSEIICDNLNMHVMFGSNNPDTLQKFSRECGEYTRLSPLSALNGGGKEMDYYQIETIPRVPKSLLSRLKPGECIITEANSGYIFWSKMERYYTCKEFSDLSLSDVKTYTCKVNPFASKYVYKFVAKEKKFSF